MPSSQRCRKVPLRTRLPSLLALQLRGLLSNIFRLGARAYVSFLVGLLKKQRALVYLVAQSSTRAIYFPKRTPMRTRPLLGLESMAGSASPGPRNSASDGDHHGAEVQAESYRSASVLKMGVAQN